MPEQTLPAETASPKVTEPLRGTLLNNPQKSIHTMQSTHDAQRVVYNSYAGTDIVAQLLLPGEGPLTIGELQTISYSIHRENTPVRFLGHVSPAGFVKGGRSIAGSMIFTVFNDYTFYRLKRYQEALGDGIFPLADMLPPFDIIISFANEYGSFSKMKIFGVTIIDEGGTMSVDDLMTESTMTYMARGITPITRYMPFIQNKSVLNLQEQAEERAKASGGGVLRF